MGMANFLEGESISDATSSARWWAPKRGIYCTEAHGLAGMAMVRFLDAGWHKTFHASKTSLISFHDWSAITLYEREAREKYQEMSVPIMKHVVVVHILFRTRTLAMAVSVANLVLGGKLRPVADAAVFKQLRDDAKEQFPQHEAHR